MFLIVPIEILSFLIRPATLSLRLFANMMAGHLMLKVFAGFSVMMLSLGGVRAESMRDRGFAPFSIPGG